MCMPLFSEIFLATQNPAKVARVRQVLAEHAVRVFVPGDQGIVPVDVAEGSDMVWNAEAKARAYFGKTSLPIVGTDTAFVVEGEMIDPALVRRNALEGMHEDEMSQQEIADAMIHFYRSLAEKRGGSVSARFVDVFVCLFSDGTRREERGERPVLLTTEVRPPLNLSFPLRSMYIAQASGVYGSEQNAEEERKELAPYREALERLLVQ